MFVLLMISITVFSSNSDNRRKNGRSSKAIKISKTSKSWNHCKKSFKMKASNSHLSNERKQTQLKRMY